MLKYIILLVTFLVFFESSNAQKYLELVPVQAPDSAGCGGKIKAIFHGGKSPYQITWWDNSWQPSTGVNAEDLCDAKQYTVSFIDSSCSYLENLLRLHADTSKQIYLDTVLISMPSAPGNCDAQVEFRFRNVLPADNPSYGVGVVNGGITSYFLNNFCENVWSFSISRGGYEEIKVTVDIRLNPPSPCFHFDDSLVVIPPANSTLCNGQLKEYPTGGSGQPFNYQFITQTGGGGSTILNGNPYQNIVGGICQGPYLVDTYNDGNIMWKRNTVFVFADSQNDSTWNTPDSLLPDTDTILLQALVNCSPHYNQGIDTAYISSVTSLGNSQYEFGITILQGADTITVYGNAITDTSLNYFIDITLFCEDSSRSIDPFLSKRNLIYHGVKLQSTASVSSSNYFSSIDIFPNPFDNRIMINYYLKEAATLKFELSDISGKIIYSENYFSSDGNGQHELYLQNINSGMYFLNIYSATKKIFSKKIIRQ